MKIKDLYREICNKLGKAKVWSMKTDKLCDYIDEHYDVEEKDEILLQSEGEKE